MKFTKMHGIGNDYVYINCFEEEMKDPVKIAPIISNRHFGVGSDGLILILPSKVADCKMRIFNADGSEAQMCGNGIRCVAKYVYDHKITQKNPLTVETLAGIKTIQLFTEDGKASNARVNMGKPKLMRSEIPMLGNETQVIDETLTISVTDHPHLTSPSRGRNYKGTMSIPRPWWGVRGGGGGGNFYLLVKGFHFELLACPWETPIALSLLTILIKSTCRTMALKLSDIIHFQNG